MKATRKKTSIKKKVTTSQAPGSWAPLLRRFEELVVENSKLGHSLDLTRKQVDMVMDRTIKVEAELEKAQNTVEALKRENASLVTQLAASKKP